METCLSVYVDFGRCVDKCCWAGLEIRGRKLAVSPLLLPYPQLTACAFLVWLPLSGSGFVNMRGSAESTFISRQSQQMAQGLANSMGLFLQKTNIIRDYLEDYAPRSAWLQRVGLKWTRGRWPSFLAPVGAEPGILPARKTMTSDARAAQFKGHH